MAAAKAVVGGGIRWRCGCQPPVPGALSRLQPQSTNDVTGMAAKRYRRQVLDPHSLCIRAAARDRGIETKEIVRSIRPGRPVARWLTFTLGRSTFYYRAGVLRIAVPDGPRDTVHINGSATRHTVSKERTKQALIAAGVSVPRGRVFDRSQMAEAADFVAELGGALCVKPNRGMQGILVFPERRGPAAVAAFAKVAGRFAEILIEESVPGDVIRYYYVHPRAVAVKISRPANIVGDGRSNIMTLIAEKNCEKRARNLPGVFPIVIDHELVAILDRHDLTLDSIPPAGQGIAVRLTSATEAGSDSIECAGVAHASYARQVEAACAAIPELKNAAIDMKVLDMRQPAAPGNHWILEINSSPGVLPYHYPWEGRPQDVSGAVIDLLARIAGAA